MNKKFLLLLLIFIVLPVSFAAEDSADIVGGDASIDYNIDVADSIELDTPQTVKVTVPDDATGDITYLIKEDIYSDEISNGTSTLTLENLTVGSYVVEISYPGDYKYTGFNTAKSFEVTKINSYNLTVDVDGGIDGSQTNVTINAPLDATGYILLAIKGSNYTSTIVNGSAKFYFNNLGFGTYPANISYNGDNRYAAKNLTTNITVSPLRNSWIYADSLVKYYLGSKQLVANLTGYYGPINNTQMSVTIDGKTYNCTTDDSGYIHLDLNQSSGTYSAFILFAGDENYDSSNRTITIIIKPTVVGNNITKTYLNGTQYYALFFDGEGNRLADTDVNITLDDTLYTVKTNASGIARLAVTLEEGTYTAIATNPVTNESVTNTVIVLGKIRENRDITKYYMNATNYSVLIIDSNDKPASGESVTFQVSDGGVYQETTNASGYATLEITQKPGTYNITVYYKNSKVNNTITVLDTIVTDDLVMYYADGSLFNALILDGTGNPYPNQNVTFRLNGVNYTATTNASGIASLDDIILIPGEFNITTYYNGYYHVNTITINPAIYADNLEMYYRDGSRFAATILGEDGNPLANATVTFKINGVLYNRTTNASGVAKLNINLNPGIYEIRTFYGSYRVINNITIQSYLVNNNDLVKYYRNASQYTIQLLDTSGNPLANTSVRFNINGVFYNRTTNASGYAKLNINLNPGTYIITAEYNGLMVSNNITVLAVLSGTDLVMNYQDGSTFKARLLDGNGNPKAGETVTFNINGIFYSHITDSNGVASLNINLMPGEYIITSSYNGTNAANTIQVK